MDMLVKLYDLDDNWHFVADQKNRGIGIRKPLGPEKRLIIDWVSETFGPAWAAEADAAQTKSQAMLTRLRVNSTLAAEQLCASVDAIR
jgi:hypothetical protein